MYVCRYVCLFLCMYVCMYMCMYICVCMCMYVCMYVCMSVCTYVCMYAWLYIYICMYVYVYACMYVCVCMCMYVCIYVIRHQNFHLLLLKIFIPLSSFIQLFSVKTSRNACTISRFTIALRHTSRKPLIYVTKIKLYLSYSTQKKSGSHAYSCISRLHY